MSPVAPIATLLAVAAGVWGGFWVMDTVTPDLPESDTEPGVEAAADIEGGDPDSLLRTGPFAIALAQLSDQIAAGDVIVSLRLEPGTLDAKSGSGGLDLEPDEIPPNAPERIAGEITQQRPMVSLDSVMFMQLRPGPGGPQWRVQLDSDVDPPRTYTAPLDGSSAMPGA
ncbi:MAG TPA: hypothetical protein VEK39_09595 [Solirubrobacterales bacterium]|nr:hypothetical protein [Solirubrobacterales bacterium]